MALASIVRDHKGDLHLMVDGKHVHGASLTSIQTYDGELSAIVVIPLRFATVGEVDNIIAFPSAKHDQD